MFSIDEVNNRVKLIDLEQECWCSDYHEMTIAEVDEYFPAQAAKIEIQETIRILVVPTGGRNPYGTVITSYSIHYTKLYEISLILQNPLEFIIIKFIIKIQEE